MSTPRQRISARDYKHGSRRDGFDIGKYQQFAIGLAVGLVAALGVFLFDHRAKPRDTEATPQARSASKAAADAPVAGAEDAPEKYDFYEMLPNSEVDTPRQKRTAQPDPPFVPTEQPGAYVVQVGAFRNEADAERMRLKVGKLGIDASLQRIAIDEEVRHRVRIGPLRDLPKLNGIRRQLRAADINATVTRLPD